MKSNIKPNYYFSSNVQKTQFIAIMQGSAELYNLEWYYYQKKQQHLLNMVALAT